MGLDRGHRGQGTPLYPLSSHWDTNFTQGYPGTTIIKTGGGRQGTQGAGDTEAKDTGDRRYRKNYAEEREERGHSRQGLPQETLRY